MKIEQLKIICKNETRKAFDEFKRQFEVRLFPFNEILKDNLQQQMLEQMTQGVFKAIFKENTLGKSDCKVLDETLCQFGLLVLKVSNNYSKKYL